MPALSDFANVDNTALVILKNLGYQIWFDTKMNLYGCEKDGWDFYAESGAALLGLVKIFELKNPQRHNEYWWRIEEPWIVQDLPSEPRPYDSVVLRDRNL